MEIEQHIWGFTEEGEVVVVYTMKSASGAYVKLCNIGASVLEVGVPDRDGRIENVALRHADFADYFCDSAALGKTVGRYANRIARGRFEIDGTEYKLARNNNGNHLHGGLRGFADKLWDCRTEVNRVIFMLVSPDGDEGYPGQVVMEVVYDWSDDNELEITYHAKTDKPTIINLTNHSYFNLAGAGRGDILSHTLQLDASRYLPTDRNQIPTGELSDVAGTPFDFREPKAIGRDVESDDPQMVIGAGYDHCWAIDDWTSGSLIRVGMLCDPASGRSLEISTTQPGVQIYTGNWLDGATDYPNRGGVAIECQLFPDSPNKPNFPTAILRPDDIYIQRIVYKFGN